VAGQDVRWIQLRLSGPRLDEPAADALAVLAVVDVGTGHQAPDRPLGPYRSVRERERIAPVQEVLAKRDGHHRRPGDAGRVGDCEACEPGCRQRVAERDAHQDEAILDLSVKEKRETDEVEEQAHRQEARRPVPEEDSAAEDLDEADDLSQLFPGISLLEQSEQDMLADVLKSDTFYMHLADLRGVVRTVRDRTIQIYRKRHRDYEASLISAREALEALPEWLKIADEDRQEIGARLVNALLAHPEGGQEIKQLQLLLVRQAAISGLLSQLQEEVERRVPKVIDEAPGSVNPVDLELSAIALPAMISSPDDLEAWLNALRTAIAEALTAGAPIRIRIRR